MLTYIPTFEQRADIFTRTLFRYHRDSFVFKDRDVYERAMFAVELADVPPTVRMIKSTVALLRLKVMLTEARWYQFMVGLMP